MRSEEKKEKDTGSEEKSSAAIAVQNGARKRKRGSGDAEPLAGDGLLSSDGRKDGDGVEVKSLRGYTVRELKALAARSGVSPIGMKMELVERLSGIIETPKENDEEEEPEEIKEEIMVTANKKGGAVLD